MRTIVVTLVFLLNFTNAVEKYDRNQVWRIVPRTKEELESLRSLESGEVDFWQSPNQLDQQVDVRLSPSQMKSFEDALKLSGMQHSVVIEDVQQLIKSQMTITRSRSSNRDFTSIREFDYSVYHDLGDIEKWGDVLVEEFGYATKLKIGVSFEGLPLNVIEIRKPSTEVDRKPMVYIDSLIHSREWITAASFMFIFKEMLTNPDYAWMIDNYDWIYIPVVNVDGYRTTWVEERLWRKTRSTGASSQCRGVDGNRNFDYHWSEPGSSSNPCSQIFYGTTPFSESITRHLTNYIWGMKSDINALLSIHSAGQLILYPYGYTSTPAHNAQQLDDLGRDMVAAIKAVHGEEYIYGASAVAIYVNAGSTTDWTHGVAGIDISYTFELRDKRYFHHLLPADQIIPTGEEILASIVVLAEYLAAQ